MRVRKRENKVTLSPKKTMPPTAQCRRKRSIMTNRDFYNAVITANFNAEITDFAKESLAKLDARNAKRASTPSKTAIANEPIKTAICDYLKTHSNVVASDLATVLEISTQKASTLCTQLTKDGKLTAAEVKVPKKGKVKGYSLAQGE